MIINGEAKTGMSLHLLDNDFDTGEILSQSSIELPPFDTARTLTAKLNTLMATELANIVTIISKKGLPAVTPQPQKIKNIAPRIHSPTEKIDWSHSAISIDRMIRANNPFSFLTTRFKNEDLIIF